MKYSSYKKFLEAKMLFFEKVWPIPDVGDGHPILKLRTDVQCAFEDALLEAVEAGIAAGKVEKMGGAHPESEFAKYGYNAAIVEAEKQSQSWLEK